MSLALEGFGSFVERSPNGVSWTTIAEVVKINGNSPSTTSIDASHLLSSTNRKEFIPGMVDEGEITLDLNFTSAEWLALLATLPSAATATSSLPYWRITLSTGNVSYGQGFITKIDRTTPTDDKISATVTIKCSGVWTHS